VKKAYGVAVDGIVIDGFGNLCTKKDEAIESLKKIIENGGVSEPQYAAKMEDFFFHYDDNQCERIYNELIK